MKTKEQTRVQEMINHIVKEDNLKNQLREHRVANISEIYATEFYQIDDYRRGAIVDVIEENRLNKTRIMIDLRQSQPVVNQVCDALYDIGKDCDIKIIVCTGDCYDYDKGMPAADEYLIANLIGRLQYENVPIVLFSIDSSDFNLKYYDGYQQWYAVNRLKNYSLPTKEGFMSQTFWCVYFDSFNKAFYTPWDAYEGVFKADQNNPFIVYIDEIISGEIRLKWDENGVWYDIVEFGEPGDDFTRMIKSYIPSLEEQYGKDAVESKIDDDTSPKIIIKFSDRPFEWLYTASPRKITEFAEKISVDAWGLRWKIEEYVDKIYGNIPGTPAKDSKQLDEHLVF